MAWTLVSDLFDVIDTVTITFVSENIARVISYAAPLVGLGLVMSLMVQGLYSMMQPNGEPLSSLSRRFVRYTIITSIAGVGGIYQTDLAPMGLNLPDTLSSTLLLDGSAVDSNSMGAVIDQTLVEAMEVAKQAYDSIGFSFASLGALVVAVHIAIVSALICGMGAAFILMAKVMLAISLAFGPAFIFCLAFDNLKYLFTPWIGSVVNYILTTALLSAVFSLLITFYQNALNDFAANSAMSFINIMVSSTVLALVAGLVTLKVPAMAAAWSSGITATVDMGAIAHGSQVMGGGKGWSKGGSPGAPSTNQPSSQPGVGGSGAQPTASPTTGSNAGSGAANQSSGTGGSSAAPKLRYAKQ